MSDERKAPRTYMVNVTLVIEANNETAALEVADQILILPLSRVQGFVQYLLPHWRDVEAQGDDTEDAE